MMRDLSYHPWPGDIVEVAFHAPTWEGGIAEKLKLMKPILQLRWRGKVKERFSQLLKLLDRQGPDLSFQFGRETAQAMATLAQHDLLPAFLPAFLPTLLPTLLSAFLSAFFLPTGRQFHNFLSLVSVWQSSDGFQELQRFFSTQAQIIVYKAADQPLTGFGEFEGC